VPEPVVVVAEVEGQPVRVLIDSGLLGDFLSTTLADELTLKKMQALTQPDLAKLTPTRRGVETRR
jgi:hypothetical protein